MLAEDICILQSTVLCIVQHLLRLLDNEEVQAGTECQHDHQQTNQRLLQP